MYRILATLALFLALPSAVCAQSADILTYAFYNTHCMDPEVYATGLDHIDVLAKSTAQMMLGTNSVLSTMDNLLAATQERPELQYALERSKQQLTYIVDRSRRDQNYNDIFRGRMRARMKWPGEEGCGWLLGFLPTMQRSHLDLWQAILHSVMTIEDTNVVLGRKSATHTLLRATGLTSP